MGGAFLIVAAYGNDQRSRRSSPGKVNDFLHVVQIPYGVHPPSYAVGTRANAVDLVADYSPLI
jgi:hypothetical protein